MSEGSIIHLNNPRANKLCLGTGRDIWPQRYRCWRQGVGSAAGVKNVGSVKHLCKKKAAKG